MLYNIGEWKVSKANAEKFLEFMGRFVEWQKQNRKKFYYVQSNFGILKNEDQTAETWMYVDVYEDQESYDKFGEDFRRSNPDWAGFLRLRDEFESLIVPNSYNCEVIVTKPELCIE